MTRQQFIDLLLSSSTVKVRDPNILGKIKLADFQKLLTNGGWKLRQQEDSVIEGAPNLTERISSIKQKSPFLVYVAPVKDDYGKDLEIFVPNNEGYDDYSDRLYDLIDTFRTVEQVVRQDHADGQGMGGGRMVRERSQMEILLELLVNA